MGMLFDVIIQETMLLCRLCSSKLGPPKHNLRWLVFLASPSRLVTCVYSRNIRSGGPTQRENNAGPPKFQSQIGILGTPAYFCSVIRLMWSLRIQLNNQKASSEPERHEKSKSIFQHTTMPDSSLWFTFVADVCMPRDETDSCLSMEPQNI